MTESKKHSGAYYTPKILSEFLAKHIFTNYLNGYDEITILEPSCGDGEFIDAIAPYMTGKNVSLDLVEINEVELAKSIGKAAQLPSVKTKGYNIDFLKYYPDYKHSLVIGNPPYISKKYLNESQIEHCKEICQPYVSGEVKNIWPAFLIRSIENLLSEGIMCFVLPSELLQVKYTSGLRKLILDTFDRVEIYAFNELIFEKVEQDVVAIIGIKSHTNVEEQGVSFYQVNRLEDLTIPNYLEMNFNVHREKLDKWTNYILSDEQLNVVERISNQLQLSSIEHYCDKAEVGIVTAANRYFIRKKSEIDNYNIDEYVRTVIQKSDVLKNTLTITQEKIDNFKDSDKAVNIICFDNVSKDQLTNNARSFITEGEKLGLHKRYKLSRRTNWYSVPSIWGSGAFFGKRSHEYPRLFLNSANVLVSDSFYRVVCRDIYSTQNLVFSFYNSLTLLLAELEGRFYGGGVLELIPSEFKSLLIPYSHFVSQDQFQHLELLFSEDKSINEILDFTDPILLPSIDKENIHLLREMRESLFNRRIKTKQQPDLVEEVLI